MQRIRSLNWMVLVQRSFRRVPHLWKIMSLRHRCESGLKEEAEVSKRLPMRKKLKKATKHAAQNVMSIATVWL